MYLALPVDLVSGCLPLEESGMLDLVPTPCKCIHMYDSLVPRPPPRFSSLGMRLYTRLYYLKDFDMKISLVLRFICRVEFRRELKVERDRAMKMERLATVPHKAAHTSLIRNSPSTEVDTSQVSSVLYKPQSSCKCPPPYFDSSVRMCTNHL